MSSHAVARWLLSYDIANPRRLGRVHRHMKKNGIPIQYSVFFMEGTSIAMQQLMKALGKLIDPRQDDIRAYRLPERLQCHTIGRSILPDCVWLAQDSLAIPGDSTPKRLTEKSVARLARRQP